MDPKEIKPPEIITDSPEFFLGQMAAIVSLEKTNRISKNQAMTSLREVVEQVNLRSDRLRRVLAGGHA